MEKKDKKDKKHKKDKESYTKVKTLGEGNFGKASLVKCEPSGEFAVIKEIDIK